MDGSSTPLYSPMAKKSESCSENSGTTPYYTAFIPKRDNKGQVVGLFIRYFPSAMNIQKYIL